MGKLSLELSLPNMHVLHFMILLGKIWFELGFEWIRQVGTFNYIHMVPSKWVMISSNMYGIKIDTWTHTKSRPDHIYIWIPDAEPYLYLCISNSPFMYTWHHYSNNIIYLIYEKKGGLAIFIFELHLSKKYTMRK